MKKNNKKINNYISEIDELLMKLDKQFHQKSSSRITEEKKYNRIYVLRDHLVDPLKFN